MYEDFVPDRIVQLRTQKGVTARDMSLSLGQNESYINRIENRKTLPSMQMFFFICEYLGVTPQDFFDQGNTYPVQMKNLVSDLQKLDERALTHIAGIVKEILGIKA